MEIEAQKDRDRFVATRESADLYEEAFLFECYDEFIASEVPNYE